MKKIRDTGKSVRVGDVVILAGSYADEYNEYPITAIKGQHVQLEGKDGNIPLSRVTIVKPVC